MKDPEVIAKLKDQGALPGGGSAEELGRFAQAELERIAKLVQTIDFKN